jgi:tetratricopeptide (TPR) repeat protein
MRWCWEKDDSRFIEILNLIGSYLGTLHYLLEREEWGRRSVEFLRKLERFEEANWHLIYDVAWTLTRKGTMKEREEGREILQSALEEARNNNWGKNIALALTNLCRMMITDGNLEKAREYLDESNLLLSEIKEDSWMNLYHRAMADLLQNLGELDEAKKIYLILRKNYIMSGDINGQIETISSLALTLAKAERCEEALQIAEESVKLAEQISPPAYSHAFALRKQAETKVLCRQIREAISDARKSQDTYQALGMTYQVNQMKEMINDLQARSRKSTESNATIDETQN